MHFCKACRENLPLLSYPRCPRCLSRVDPELTSFCSICQNRRFVFEQLFACFEFYGVTRLALNALKFKGVRPLARFLSQAVLKNLPGDFNPEIYDLLLPVPLPGLRRLNRGFNQAEEIAGCLAGEWNIPMNTNALKRKKSTAPMSGAVTYQARQKLIKGCFSVPDPALIKNKRVLVFDDIATTRFTVNECATTLMRAGAKEVDAFVVAVSALY